MKRQSFITIPGIVMTISLLIVIGVDTWYKGGMAFSPGRLSRQARADVSWQGFKSHRDFEAQCKRCHDPLHVEQHELCTRCHENIAQQIAQSLGTHSLIPDVNRCASCHPDHRGADFDLVSSAFPTFNHEQTTFSLKRHQVNFRATPIPCADCHAVNTDFSPSKSKCADCHASDDPDFIRQHILEFGDHCLLCHDGQDRFSNFNHLNTGFALEGKHQSVACLDCHQLNPEVTLQGTAPISSSHRTSPISVSAAPAIPNNPFTTAPKQCVGCHPEPAVHGGSFSQNCESCHTAHGWLPATLNGKLFNHTFAIAFNLTHHRNDYDQRVISCKDCHSSDLRNFDIQTCINCHQKGETQAGFLQQHQTRYSSNCLDCHDGADRMDNFDHASFFPLDGKHAELDCAQCHIEKKFFGTPAECSQCHAEPGIHSGFFGLKCQYCHTAQAWFPAKLHNHNFPLDHGTQGEVACQVCHPTKYAEYTCYGCHDHQAEAITSSHQSLGISQVELLDCVVCHSNGLIQNKP